MQRENTDSEAPIVCWKTGHRDGCSAGRRADGAKRRRELTDLQDCSPAVGPGTIRSRRMANKRRVRCARQQRGGRRQEGQESIRCGGARNGTSTCQACVEENSAALAAEITRVRKNHQPGFAATPREELACSSRACHNRPIVACGGRLDDRFV